VGPERGGEIAEPRAVHVVDGHLRRADDDVAESREPSREHGLREAAERLLESPGCAKGRSADRETAQRSVPPVTEVGMRSQTFLPDPSLHTRDRVCRNVRRAQHDRRDVRIHHAPEKPVHGVDLWNAVGLGEKQNFGARLTRSQVVEPDLRGRRRRAWNDPVAGTQHSLEAPTRRLTVRGDEEDLEALGCPSLTKPAFGATKQLGAIVDERNDDRELRELGVHPSAAGFLGRRNRQRLALALHRERRKRPEMDASLGYQEP
jgi:hypothetical protein